MIRLNDTTVVKVVLMYTFFFYTQIYIFNLHGEQKHTFRKPFIFLLEIIHERFSGTEQKQKYKDIISRQKSLFLFTPVKMSITRKQ